MAWDAGTEVAVAGQPFGGALRLVNEISREDAIDRRIASGGKVYVQGWVRRTDAGVTAQRIGLETQNEARSATATALFSVALGAVGTWTPFSGFITTTAGHVWGRPYLQAVGGGVEFAEIYIGSSQPGATAGADWADVTDSAGTKPANNATVGAIFGTNLLEASAGALATLANFKTTLGVASAVAGQTAWATFTGAIGGLATKSAVDFATSEVANRTAANLAYAGGATVESLKPAEAGATLGGVFGTNLRETAGGALATLANFKTSSGVASAVAGQTLWATYGGAIGALASKDLVGNPEIDTGAVATANILPHNINEFSHVVTAVLLGPRTSGDLLLQQIAVTATAEDDLEFGVTCEIIFDSNQQATFFFQRVTGGVAVNLTVGSSLFIVQHPAGSRVLLSFMAADRPGAGSHTYQLLQVGGTAQRFTARQIIAKKRKR